MSKVKVATCNLNRIKQTWNERRKNNDRVRQRKIMKLMRKKE